MSAEQRRRVVSCSDAASALPAMVDAGGGVAPDIWAHANTCLRCQAELARYRHMLRSLHSLRCDWVKPAPGALRVTLEALETARPARRVAVAAYVGGAVVATAASAAGMMVWATRRRVGLAS